MRKDLNACALLILCAAVLCAPAQTRRTTGSRTTATQPATIFECAADKPRTAAPPLD